MRFTLVVAMMACVAGCADTGFGERAASPPGLFAVGKPGTIDRRRQVLMDVAAMAEGMEGARLSRVRRAGM